MTLKLAVASKTRLAGIAVLIALLITACYQRGEGHSQARDSRMGLGTTIQTTATESAQIENVAMVTARSSTRAALTVFLAINSARRKAHLPALRWVAGLHKSALTHDFTMARRNVLSHQLPHEAAFGNRISAQRVSWTMAGENIGWTSALSAPGAVSVNAMMLAEKAPNNGHRLNILSRKYNVVGIDVVMDLSHHRLWLTEDFARV